MPADRQDLIRSAERMVSRGKLNLAIGEYLKVLDDYPDDTTTLNRVGDLYARSKRIDEATELFRRAAERFSEQGFFEKAIAIYKKILRFDSTQLEVTESLADLQARHGLVIEARRHYQAVAEGFLKAEDVASATAVHRKLADLEPDDPTHRLHLAGLLKRQNRIPDAMVQYLSIAEQMLSHEKVDQAVRVCREALELDPSNLDFVSSVVGELQRQGHESEADLFLQAAVEKNPDVSRISAGLAKSSAPEPVSVVAAEDEVPEEAPEVAVVDEDAAAVVTAEEEFVTTPEEELELEESEDFYELDLGDEEEIDIDLEELRLEPKPEPEPVPQPEPEPVSEAQRPLEVGEEVSVEDERLKELLIEADVLARYGLEEKAVEKLEEIIDVAPSHLDAHCRLVGLYLEQGNVRRVAVLASVVNELATEQSRLQEWEALWPQLEEQGFQLEEDRVVAPEPVEVPEPAPEPVEEPAVAVVTEEMMEAAVGDDLSWLDQVPSSEAAGQQEEVEVFEAEEEFFDLASELEKELIEEEGLLQDELMVAPEEQTLEEIVEGFRRGMAETLSAEDYDTHYNLGIAYREMGLLDEAISEFQLAAKDARYLVDCCSLLASCFMEKGFPELAIKWYNEGLNSSTITEEETLGLAYELGDLYLSIGETEEARQRFVEIYGINSDYRDVGSKLMQLDQA